MNEPTVKPEDSEQIFNDAVTLGDEWDMQPMHDILVWGKVDEKAIVRKKGTPGSRLSEDTDEPSVNPIHTDRLIVKRCYELTLGTETGGGRASIQFEQDGTIYDLPTGKVTIVGVVTRLVIHDFSHFPDTNFEYSRDNGTEVRNATWQGGNISIMDMNRTVPDQSRSGGLAPSGALQGRVHPTEQSRPPGDT